MLFATRQNIYRNAISSPMRRLLSICALILCACQSPAAIEPMISGSSVEDDQIYAADDLAFYTAMNDANTPEHGKAPALRNEKCALLGESFAQAATIGAAYGAQSRLGNAGMPKNARQTTEGYWVGAQPMPSEIDELHARNIRVVVTAAAMESDTFRAIKSKLDDHGIRHTIWRAIPQSKGFLSDDSRLYARPNLHPLRTRRRPIGRHLGISPRRRPRLDYPARPLGRRIPRQKRFKTTHRIAQNSRLRRLPTRYRRLFGHLFRRNKWRLWRIKSPIGGICQTHQYDDRCCFARIET